MENRHRDKISQSEVPTDAGQVNREVEERRGNEKDDSDAEFGQKIGRAEKPLEEPNQRG